MIVVGGLIEPILMLVGLRHVSRVAGALLLNLAGPFTMVLAIIAFGEHLGVCAAVGAVLVVAGAMLLSLGPEAVRADGAGLAAIAGACLAWAFDNSLSARLALRDPVAVARCPRELLVGLLMAAGITLLGREEQEHEPLIDEHRHLHHEHHAHAHDPPVGPGEAHSHVHTHARRVHDHPDVSDAHHRHRH